MINESLKNAFKQMWKNNLNLLDISRAELNSELSLHLNDYNPHNITIETIGAASDTHTHLYAGSSSIGGPADYLKVQSSNEINFKGLTKQTYVRFNYKDADTNTIATNNLITGYYFQNKGASTTGVTLYAENFSGTAAKATSDGSGNNIVNTYATKDALKQVSGLVGDTPVYSQIDAALTYAQTYTNNEIAKLIDSAPSHLDTLNKLATALGKISNQIDNKANTNHTHLYAGSSSAGGSATSAVKLDTTTAGDSNTPVYFSEGKPVACTSLDLNTSGNAATASKVNNKLTVGTKNYDGSEAITIAASDLGLASAMLFLGTTTTAITDGATTNPVTIGGASKTVTAGNVVLYGSKEFAWTGSAWEELGNEGSYKIVQSAVADPSASGTSNTFIATISQDTNGNITASKKTVAVTNSAPTLSWGATSTIGSVAGTDLQVKMPANPNTDTKVTQTAVTASGYTNWRPLVIGSSNSGTEGFSPTTVTDTTFTVNTISCQPSSGTVKATTFKGNASTATKLATTRTIGIGTGATGTATNFDGSGNITIPVTSVKEAYLSWGGKNFSGAYGPIDAAMVPDLGANRLAFMPAAGVEVQYSRDGGSTWSTYSTSDASKINLFNGNGAGHYIGANTATGIDKSNYQLRITITTNTAKVYTALNKFVIYCSTNGSSGSWCTIDAKTKANVDSGTDTWVTFANKVSLSGWSGYNVINTPDITTYGNTSSQHQKLRFTFGVTSHPSSSAYSGLIIYRIMGFGGNGWTTPSTMAATGRMYTYDYAQNVTFPAKVTASQFNGTATTANKVANTLTIQGNGTTLTNGTFDGSAAKTVNITPASIGAATSSHTHSASNITAGTLDGKVVANTSAVGTLTTKQLRNITISTADPTSSDGGNGDVWITYGSTQSDCPFPVGGIYISIASTNPSSIWAGTTWEQFAAGRTLVGLDTSDADFNTVGQTDGEKEHTLTTNEIPAHGHGMAHTHSYTGPNTGSWKTGTNGKSHTWCTSAGGKTSGGASKTTTDNTGGGSAHNNLQPYIVVYMWKRVS